MHSEAGQGGWYSWLSNLIVHLSQIKLSLPSLFSSYFCNFTSRLDFGSFSCHLQGSLFLPPLILKANELKTYK